MPRGGEGVKTPEEVRGIEVEQIHRAEFLQYKHEIQTLRHSILKDGENDNIHKKTSVAERKAELRPIQLEFRSPGEHEAAFIAKNSSGKVVGFLFIALDPHTRSAEIEEMWSAVPERFQAEIVAKLVGTARSELVAKGYLKLDFDGTMSRQFRRQKNTAHARYLRENESTHQEAANDMSSVENYNAPAAANENEPEQHEKAA